MGSKRVVIIKDIETGELIDVISRDEKNSGHYELYQSRYGQKLFEIEERKSLRQKVEDNNNIPWMLKKMAD